VTPWNSENGTVIPNANSVIQGSATLFGFPAYAGYQSFFMEGQSAINITRAAGARVGNNCRSGPLTRRGRAQLGNALATKSRPRTRYLPSQGHHRV